METIITLFLGMALGAGLVHWLASRQQGTLSTDLADARELVAGLRAELAGRDRLIEDRDGTVQALNTSASESETATSQLRALLVTKGEESAARGQRIAELEKYEAAFGLAQQEIARLNEERGRSDSNVAALKAQIEADRLSNAEKIALVQASDQRTEERFNGLAAQILERNTEKLGAANEAKLGAMLKPLDVQLSELKQQVTNVHTKDVEDRATLRAKLDTMALASQQLSTGATDLTRALKGDSQVRGAWGEVILERVLEQCGLREGHEYSRQANLTGEDNQRLRPDAIVNLPGSRHVIVDSKLSLVAYVEHVNAADDADGEAALARHIASMRSHIRQLSDKEYWKVEGLNTVDYVLMFVPIESAFTAALKADANLFVHAFEKRIVIASPTTLLALLRTIEHTWRVERQNQNAIEIVRAAEKLYDKFRVFSEELVAVGTGIDKARSAYGDAMSKLTTGRGNIVGRFEHLKTLGVRASKPLPPALVSGGEQDDLPNPALLNGEGTLPALSAGDE